MAKVLRTNKRSWLLTFQRCFNFCNIRQKSKKNL
jgi:hypothetical protein